jgi:hypothetical protein
MIRYIRNDEIDIAKWDDCISKSSNSIVYAQSWYLDIVSPFWDALVLDDYEAVFPLTWRVKWGVNYLYQPFFTQQLGLFSKKETDPSLLQEFLAEIPSKFKLIEINLNAHNIYNGEPAFETEERITHLLDLNQPYEIIAGNYSDNTKRNIKKAEKAGLIISESDTIKSAIDIFKREKSKVITALKDDSYSMLERIADTAIENNQGKFFEVKDADQNLHSAAFFLISGKYIIHLFSTTTAFGRESGAMHYMMDAMIKSHANSQFIFDFEGSNIPSIARFYKSFGGYDVSYLHISRNRLPWWLRPAFYLYKRSK